MTAPLAEVVLWGNETVRAAKLARERDTADRRTRVFQMEQFFIEHGPRLLAVASAAVEWDARQEEMAAGLKRGWDRPAYVTADINLTNARCALRAAVQGEEGGEANAEDV